jgi:predicted nicotinamide N-methyase
VTAYDEDLVQQRLALPGGELVVLQPDEAAELPDDGPVEWAPLVPYWAVLWRSGLALARELEGEQLEGKRVIELGCGLGVPSLVAARAGARVTATDEDPDALELLQHNARENGIEIETAQLDWSAPGEPGRFDLVLAADVLYERASVALLLKLLPRLTTSAVWLADPGRAGAEAFLVQARRRWTVASGERDGMQIHRLTSLRRPPARASRPPRRD